MGEAQPIPKDGDIIEIDGVKYRMGQIDYEHDRIFYRTLSGRLRHTRGWRAFLSRIDATQNEHQTPSQA